MDGHGRHVAGGPTVSRSRPRSRVLRARRERNRDRCQPGAGPPPPRSLSWGRNASRSSTRATKLSTVYAPVEHSPIPRPSPKEWFAWPTPAWRARFARSLWNAATIHVPLRFSLSAAPARCTPARSRRRSVSGQVLVPAAPGALSALGILDADLRREFSRTVMLAPGSPRIPKVFAELEAEARTTFRSEGVNPTLMRAADLRYEGQGFELRVDWSANVIARFHAMHERSYGYADPARSVEVVTLRVQAVARTPRPRQTAAPIIRGDGRYARIGRTPDFREWPLVSRSIVRSLSYARRRSHRWSCRHH